MLKRKLLSVSIASSMVIGLFLNAMPISVFASTNTVNLSETSEAFKNPMKGFRPSRYIQDTSFKDYEYTTTYKQYIKYTDLENFATDSVQKIKDWSNASWDNDPRVAAIELGLYGNWGENHIYPLKFADGTDR